MKRDTMTDTIQIKKPVLDKVLLATSVVFIALAFVFYNTPYTPLMVFTILFIVWGGYFAYMSREEMTEMGGMTGVMVRFFDVKLFMPFFVIVVLFTVWEMVRVIHNDSKKISRSFIAIGAVLSLLAFSSAVFN